MTSRNAERWRQAKAHKNGVQVTIEFYIPIPRKHRTQPRKAREKIVETVTPAIEQLRKMVKSYDGILHTYQHV